MLTSQELDELNELWLSLRRFLRLKGNKLTPVHEGSLREIAKSLNELCDEIYRTDIATPLPTEKKE